MNQTIRVLLVDDHSPFRDFLRTSLEQIPKLEVVGEALDGDEAIQKVRELSPDLILLDIGLPKLDGLEVARQIQKFSAHSIILIVSCTCDWDLIEHAFLSGARGYLVKYDAEKELISAVETVRRGSQYISATGVRRILKEYRHGGPSRMLNRISSAIAREAAGEPGD